MVLSSGTSSKRSPGTPAQPHAIPPSLSSPILQHCSPAVCASPRPAASWPPPPPPLLLLSEAGHRVQPRRGAEAPLAPPRDAATRRPRRACPQHRAAARAAAAASCAAFCFSFSLFFFFFVFPSKPPQAPSSIPPRIIPPLACNALAALKLPLPHPSLLRRLSRFGSASGL